jgi:pimeloyl-ACP methyl ester carboxylesterase
MTAVAHAQQRLKTGLLIICFLLASVHGAVAYASCEDKDAEALKRIDEDAVCELITVPLDHNAPDGATIELRLITLPATSRNPADDPMVFLAGGPGQSAVQAAPFWLRSHQALRSDRAFIFLDQRGTGGSASLACADDLEPLFANDFEWWMTQEAAIKAQQEGLQACLDKLPYSPSHFTTASAVRDLAAVLDHLGVVKANLFGVSYGTRMALAFLREHEDRVRSVLLDAVAPHSMVIPARVADDARAALDHVFTACKKSTACNARFPDLAATLEIARQQLEAADGPISVVDPLTGETVEFVTWPDMLSNILRAGLYSRELIRLFPLAIERGSRGQFDSLITIASMLAQESPRDLSLGMMASVLCAEDMRRLPPSDEFANRNPLVDSLAPICEFWPSEPAAERLFEPVRSDVPALLLSGQFDPITPPRYAIEIEPNLSRSHHVIIQGWAHGVSGLGCIPEVIEFFVADPADQDLDTDCMDDIQIAPFFLSPSGAFGGAYD